MAGETPVAAASDTLTVRTYRGDFTLSNTAESSVADQFIFDGLYRVNSKLEPVPNLASRLCDAAADGITITCQLREGLFHDGTPVTADDVAFTYELSRSPQCVWGGGDTTFCVFDKLASVRAIDEHTVEFVLSRPDASLPTTNFPVVGINARHVVMEQFDALMREANGHDPKALVRAADATDKASSSGDSDCQPLLDANDALLSSVGVAPIARDFFNFGQGGSFAPCAYAGDQASRLRAVATALRLKGIDAIAAAYPVLPLQQHPVGTGAWKVTRLGPTAIDLDAFPQSFHGAPATAHVHLRAYETPEEFKNAFDGGGLDIAQFLQDGDEEALKGDPSAVNVSYIANTLVFLAYNQRPGMLFADINLRRAVELCIDKPRTVEAATSGTGAPIYSAVSPPSWAYAADIPHPQRDVQAARGLIEASGWSAGGDGIYRKGGRRLAAKVWVRAEASDRIQFVELVAGQLKDCGMQLTTAPASFDDLTTMLARFPHDAPGTRKPFDVYLGASNLAAFDPGLYMYGTFHSSRITGPSLPTFDPFGEDANFEGYSNARVDELLQQGRVVYDQRQRAQIYLEAQRIMEEDQPFLFCWSPLATELRAADVFSKDGPLGTNAPNVLAQWESLEVSAH